MKSTNAQLREQAGLRLMLLARLYRRELDVALKPYGLSEANTAPMRYLGQHPQGVRQGALAAALYLEGPSLIRVLDQLIDAGYIARLDDPADGWSVPKIWRT
jgi:MarR family transcriptional regulator for hemolysin